MKQNLKITKRDQVKVVGELIENSRLTPSFYLMLSLSSIIVSLGLLVGNAAVIIGGMLITPLLTPFLALSLGLVISDKRLILRSLKISCKASLIVIVISLIVSFLFPANELNGEIYLRLVSNIPYFLIAFTAGLAATFAWTKKDMSAILPGVAVTVSVLPPLSVIGIGISKMSINVIRGSLVSFLLNLLGIILGSMVIFSLLSFHKAKKVASEEMKKEEKMEEKEK